MPAAAQQQQFDDFQRLTGTREVAVRCLRAMFNIGVKAQARQVRCPTLVFHARGDRLIYFDQGRKLAGLIPGARLVPFDGDNHVPFVGERRGRPSRPRFAPFSERPNPWRNSPRGSPGPAACRGRQDRQGNRP